MIIKTEIRSQETRRFIICQSKGQADILKAAELSIFKITMEGKAQDLLNDANVKKAYLGA